MLATLSRFANEGGLLPEQVWDGADIPACELYHGRPTGSAMPLVWAHAEYVKLCRSIADGRVFDMPPQTVQRYQVDQVGSTQSNWRFNHKCRTIPAGHSLRIEALVPARVRFSTDGWATFTDRDTRNTGLGMHLLDLPAGTAPPGGRIDFTFYWPQSDRWEGRDYAVCIEPSSGTQGAP